MTISHAASRILTGSALRTIIAVIGFGGALLFGAAFAVSYARPTAVESLAKNFIRVEMERNSSAAVHTIESSVLVRLVVARLDTAGMVALRRQLADSVQARVARVAAEMRDADCPCRRFVEEAAGAVYGFPRGTRKPPVDQQLTALIRAAYMDFATKILREFRIFTAANALVLLLLGVAVVRRRDARLHLLPPALILVCSAVVIGYYYLFRQDWLHAVVFSDYVGLAYFGYLGAAFVLIADILLNRGRMTAGVVNAGSSVVGSAVNVLPC